MEETAVAGKPDQKRRPRTGALILALLAASTTLVGVAGMLYLSFAPTPVAIGSYVMAGPECEAQPASRLEMAYLAAKGKGDAQAGTSAPVGRSEFAGIKFYRNVPWGPREQQAPLGPR